MDARLVAPCEYPTAAREGQSLKQRPLPKTVAPLADELLTGWLTRLAVTNHCEVDELLSHIGVDTRQAAMLDFDVEVAATTAEKISIAARVTAETVQSLAFGALTPTEALMTAQVGFQSCPDCSRRGIALKQWRKLWAFDCQICGTRLLSILIKPDHNQISEKLVRRARSGAALLESAVRSNSANKLRRAMRAATYAKALKSVRADAAFALQSPRPEVRLFCLAAIAAAQSRPLVKAAMFSTDLDGYARVTLLRAFEKEPRLLAAVDRIVLRRREELRRAGA
jgi:hypothetical protein